MRHIGAVGAIDSGHVLHGVEIRAPVFRYRAGIKEIGLVQFFHVRGIPSKQIGVGEILLHHHCSPFFALREVISGFINHPHCGHTALQIAKIAGGTSLTARTLSK